MITELLEPFREREDIKLDELVSLAATIIPKVTGGTHLRQRVSEIPDARTVRYYIQEGLVDRPQGSEGAAALYGYRHLLQLVAIKALQGHFLPIRAIRQALDGLDTPALEKRLEEWLADATPNTRAAWRSWTPLSWVGEAQATAPPNAADDRSAALRSLESLQSKGTATPPGAARRAPAAARGTKSRAPVASSPVASPQTPYMPDEKPHIEMDEEAPEYLDRPQLSARIDATEASQPPRPPDSPAPTIEGTWHRVELHPGIELHIREGTRVPSSPSFLSALASRLRVILETFMRR